MEEAIKTDTIFWGSLISAYCMLVAGSIEGNAFNDISGDGGVLKRITKPILGPRIVPDSGDKVTSLLQWTLELFPDVGF